ncbi:MAG: hypothetical protein WDW38_002745 [Sanguina aurantia]
MVLVSLRLEALEFHVVGPLAGAHPSQPATPSRQRSFLYPRSIHEVDNGRLLGFGADLAADHPGFHDEEYKQRRVDIARLAFSHEIGQPIPRVEYTAEEAATWGSVMRELEQLFPAHACSTFLQAYPQFGFSPDTVPQLCDVSEVLQRATGWRIRPVAGLMHPRDFLAGLAFRTFHSTQYMRHTRQPGYTPEPDLCHELLGHVAMLADPAYAKMVEAIGVASLGASDKEIWHLTKVYWYTVEFGVVQEGGCTKAFGAGILSSYGEMKHMAAGGAELLPLDPVALQPKMSYKDGFQKAYYVLEGFEQGTRKLQEWARQSTRDRTGHPTGST